MMKKWFDVKKKVMGITTKTKESQREFDFLLVGARKACLFSAELLETKGLLFLSAFDVHFAYPEEFTKQTMTEDEEVYFLNALIVKKGTDVSSALFKKDGVTYFRHAEVGILLGFPPKECLSFSDLKERVFVHYHELHFATEKSRLEESLSYVASTFKLPKWMETNVFITE